MRELMSVVIPVKCYVLSSKDEVTVPGCLSAVTCRQWTSLRIRPCSGGQLEVCGTTFFKGRVCECALSHTEAPLTQLMFFLWADVPAHCSHDVWTFGKTQSNIQIYIQYIMTASNILCVLVCLQPWRNRPSLRDFFFFSFYFLADYTGLKTTRHLIFANRNNAGVYLHIELGGEIKSQEVSRDEWGEEF